MVFVIEQPREEYRCSNCDSDRVTSRGTTLRRFRSMPMGSKPIFLEYAVHRLHCWACDYTRQPAIPFADPKKHSTRSFARYVLELCQVMTIQEVADHLGISWDTVKEIQKTHFTRHNAKPRLKDLVPDPEPAKAE